MIINTAGVDTTANVQLVLREREARDRRWWAEARDCFHPDSQVNVGWFKGTGFDFVAGSEKMARNGGNTAHRVASPIVHLGGDRAVVVLGALITSRAVIDNCELDLEAAVRLLYRTERRDSTWRIAHMDCIYEKDRLDPSVPGVTFQVPADELVGLRPSYRMLAWSFQRRGMSIRDDLLADDEPERVAAFERGVFAWAGLNPPA